MYRKIQKIILLVDTSGSMDGSPIKDIKLALKELYNKIIKFNSKHRIVKLKIITFSNDSKFVTRNNIKNITANGKTNLASAYKNLNLLFKNNNKFDYPPIILLLCDGSPNIGNEDYYLKQLYRYRAFKNSYRFAFAYNKQSKETLQVLTKFTNSSKNVFTDNSSKLIKYIIEDTLPKIVSNKRIVKSPTMVKIFTNNFKLFKLKKGRNQC